MRRFILLLAFISLLCCSAGNKQDSHIVLWVNSSLGPCVGMAPTLCLQVQKSDTPVPEAWKSFHSPIRGFEFEQGYYYKLLVQEHHLETNDLPADAASVEYTLVEILDRREDLRFRIQGSWELLKLNEEAIPAEAGGIRPPRLDIHVGDMRYTGFDGCNNFTGGIVELDENSIKLGVAAGTRMLCESMEIPDLFNAGIPGIRNWEINEDRLLLFNAEGRELFQFRRSDQ